MQSHEPAFKKVFGAAWSQLPTVFLKRYSNRAHTNDITTVTGKMEISYSRWLSWMMPICKLIHLLVPYHGKNIPITADFCSHEDKNGVTLARHFLIENNKAYDFISYMKPLGENDVVEIMPLGLGWRTRYYYENGKVIMQHRNYVLCMGKFLLPLPLHIFLGKGYAEEVMIDDQTYSMEMHIKHRWFGILYSYSGTFKFTKATS